ncbi:MAG: hypothetical protein PHT84_06315 [Candidatus Pacebacteria bacterium]|nr:hypothetical protein [Candidatus Paceibacterota bacterium]
MSDNSFIITIVLLKAIATEINADVIKSNPNNRQIQSPIAEVNTTCQIPVIVATLPTSLIILGFNHKPTINSKITTPIFDKVVISEDGCTTPVKLTINHVIIYPIISGCFKRFIM